MQEFLKERTAQSIDFDPFTNIPRPKVMFDRFVYNEKYTFELLDIRNPLIRKTGQTTIYLVYLGKPMHNYRGIAILKGDLARIYFPHKTFMPELAKQCRLNNIRPEDMQRNQIYNIELCFIRYNKFKFEILGMKFIKGD